MVCQWCGNTFTAQKSNTRYCSKRCADLANKQRMREMTQTIVDTHSSIKKERETARNESEILSPKLVAEFLGVSRSTAYDYIARGIIAYSHDIDPHSYDVDPLEEGMAFKEQSLFACKQAVVQLYKGITFSFS